MSDGPRLVRIQDRRYVSATAFDGQPIAVGRQSDNQIAIREAKVSRYHLRVERSGDTWFVLDLQSTHGTWVNGERVSGPRALVHGDILCPGGDPVHLLVFLEREDEAAVMRALTGALPRHTGPEDALAGECPLCGADVSRSAEEMPLPAACPGCARQFVMLPKLEAAQLVRTPFRLALRAEVSGLPCLVREPVPLPLPPGLEGTPRILAPDVSTPATLRHELDVVAVAALDDGTIRSVDRTGEIRTWDAATGEALERLLARGFVLAFAPDGRTALVAMRRGVAVVRLDDGAIVMGPVALRDTAIAGTFGADGRIAVAGRSAVSVFPPGLGAPDGYASPLAGESGSVILLGEATIVLAGGRVVVNERPMDPTTWSVEGDDVRAGVAAPDGRGVLLAGRDPLSGRSRIYRLDLATRTWRPLVMEAAGEPSALAVSPDGYLIAWGAEDGRVTCVRVANGKTVIAAQQHTQPVRALAFDAKSTRLVSGGADGRVAVLPLDRSEPRVDEGPSGGTVRLVASASASRVFMLTRDGMVRLHGEDAVEHRRWRTRDCKELAVDTGAQIVAAGSPWGVESWAVYSGEQLWQRGPGTRGHTPLVAVDQETGAVISFLAGRVTARHRETARELWEMEVPERAQPVAFLPHGREMIAIGAGGEVLVVALPGGSILRRFGANTGLWPHQGGVDHPRPIRPQKISSDGGFAALIAGGRRAAVFVDLVNGQAWRPGSHARVSAVAVSWGGRLRAVAYDLYGLVIFGGADFAPVARWMPAGTLGPFDRRIDALAFSPNGSVLFAGTREGQFMRFGVPF